MGARVRDISRPAVDSRNKNCSLKRGRRGWGAYSNAVVHIVVISIRAGRIRCLCVRGKMGWSRRFIRQTILLGGIVLVLLLRSFDIFLAIDDWGALLLLAEFKLPQNVPRWISPPCTKYFQAQRGLVSRQPCVLAAFISFSFYNSLYLDLCTFFQFVCFVATV